jgi:hypothetical protein
MVNEQMHFQGDVRLLVAQLRQKATCLIRFPDVECHRFLNSVASSLASTSNALDQKRAETLELASPSAPVFCILMLGGFLARVINIIYFPVCHALAPSC